MERQAGLEITLSGAPIKSQPKINATTGILIPDAVLKYWSA